MRAVNPLRSLLLGVVVSAGLVVPAAASAATPSPFGHTCASTAGVRFCPTTDAGPGRTADGVPSFDGVPLDVDVTLPATGNGPFPTIVMLHGWGNDKTSFEASSPAGDGNETYHYNNIYFAQRGYAVVNYTARGFGHSCGGGPLADHTGACANGYIHLADTRYEARDTQYLLGLLADQGITNPKAIGVTGISYGGGQSLELAYLKDRVRTASGALTPWRSPKGTPLSISAAYPRWEWSDLVDALLPNGRFLDFNNATNGLSRDPIGVEIASYVSGLFALGGSSGYYCGEPPAVPCTDSSANLPFQYAEVTRGEPVDSTDMALADDIYTNHQAYGLPLPAGGPAPLLLQNGWTDDLFPPSQALRAYNQILASNPKARISLQFADLGHSRGSNKPETDHAFQDQGSAFFDGYLMGHGKPLPSGSVEAFTQTCPAGAPDGGPFTASSWAALHPLTLSFGSGAAQTVTATGDAQDGPPFDPIAGTTDACKTITSSSGPGTAVYTLPSHGFTLLGLPTVTATINTTGPFGELDSRLYDVMPGGTERLISRGTYRLLDNQSGRITFQLHGNGYYFPPGDVVKLELRGNDAPYYRPSNDAAFTVQVSNLSMSLPLPAAPMHATVRPARTRAGRRTSFGFTVTTTINGAKVPLAGARVTVLGHSAVTGSEGRATLKLALPHRGTFKAKVTKLGLRTIALPLHATASSGSTGRRPTFTG